MKLDKIERKLSEYAAERKERADRLKMRREEARENLKKASDTLELTEDPNEYTKATDDIARYKAEIEFYNKHLNNPTAAISEPEFVEIADTLKDAVAELATNAKPKLESKYADLIKAFNRFYTEAYEINDLYILLCNLANKKGGECGGIAAPAIGSLKDSDTTPFSFDKMCVYFAQEKAKNDILNPHSLTGRFGNLL